MKRRKPLADQILVRGHGGGVRGIVPVRERDQRRRVDECDVPQDFPVRGVCDWRSVGRHPRPSPASAAEIGRTARPRCPHRRCRRSQSHPAEDRGRCMSGGAEIRSVSPPLRNASASRAVDEPLTAQPAAGEFPFAQIAAHLLRRAPQQFGRVRDGDQAATCSAMEAPFDPAPSGATRFRFGTRRPAGRPRHRPLLRRPDAGRRSCPSGSRTMFVLPVSG